MEAFVTDTTIEAPSVRPGTSTKSPVLAELTVEVTIPGADYASIMKKEGSGRIQKIHLFEGAEFLLDTDDDLGIVLTHPKWSLMGSGRTLVEAENDMRRMARDLLPAYLPPNATRLTAEANRMCNFMLSIS